MEIKSNKPGIARSTQENRALAKALKANESQASQSSSGTKQLDLKEGQQVKGEVLDIRYHEVRLRLDPGKQVVTARLSGDIPLSIGEEARFQVTESNGQHLSLKYLPENSTATDATVMKALTASGLPFSDRNKAIVEELLNHRMPIDKQTLQLLAKTSLINKEALVRSLVLMYKNNIPLTASNIRQYEAYQNGSGQLLKDIQFLAKNSAELLKQSDSYADSGYPVKTALTINQELLDILIPGSSIISEDHEGIPLNAVISKDQLDQLNNILQQKSSEIPPSPAFSQNPLLSSPSANTYSGISEEMLSQLQTGSLPLDKALTLITQLYPDVASAAIIPEDGFGAHPGTDAIPPVLQKLFDQITEFQNNTPLLSSILTPDEQSSITELISVFPDSLPLQNKLSEGTATLQETLTFLREKLMQADPAVAGELLHSSEYSRLLEAAFHEKWTLSPEKLEKKGSVSELYQNLQEASQKLSSLISTENASAESLRLQEPVKNLQENLRFLKDLNEMFTYVPLPVQLKDQEVHSELYVFTNKKSLQEKKNLSVLLHLDMTNLGSLNVHVQMDHNVIHTKFYMEDSDAKELIEDHLSLLSRSLKEKGYQFVSEVFTNYQKPDFTKDLIEQNADEGSPARYTFDIRT